MDDKYVVGQSYSLPDGKFVYKGGDATKKKNWVKEGTISSGAFKLGNLITGKGRYEPDIPEIGKVPASVKGSFKAAAGLLVSPDVENAKNVIKNSIPGVTFKEDKFGSTLAVINNQPYYINKPGMSGQDISRAAVNLVSFLRLGKAFGVGQSGRTVLGNAARSAAAGGAISASEDVASGLLGSEQEGLSIPFTNIPTGIDPTKAASTAAMTGIFQGGGDVLFAAIPSLARGLKNVASQLRLSEGSVFNSAGDISQAGKKLLSDLGYEWAAMTKEFQARLRNEFVKATPASAKEAVKYAEAQSLPIAVPQTKGALSGSPSQQLKEDMARKGAFGEEAESLMKIADENAAQALRENIPKIQEVIAGGSPLVGKSQGASQAQSVLATAREAEKKAVDAAYQQARDLAAKDSTMIPSIIFKNFGQKTEDVISQSHALDDLAPVKEMIKRFKDLGTLEKGVPITRLFDLRKQINSKMEGNFGTETAVALGSLKRQLDDEIDSLTLTVLKEGDNAVIKGWRDAIKSYKDYAQKWQGKNVIDKITQTRVIGTTPEGKAINELVIAPEDVGRYIFNSSNLGFLNKQGLQRNLLQLKKVLPLAEWNSLRQEIFLKIVNAGKMSSGDISGAKLFTSVNKAFDENSALMNSVFSLKEQSLLKQFSNVANTTLNTAKNTSNTAAANANLLRDLWARVVPALGITNSAKWAMAFPIVSGFGKNIRTIQTKDFISAVPGRSVIGAEAGAVGMEYENIANEQNKPSIISR
tara:strand:- start:42 stop:2306 length:2265 start_codon:yes stop_codon:yes gene_type:complete